MKFDKEGNYIPFHKRSTFGGKSNELKDFFDDSVVLSIQKQ